MRRNCQVRFPSVRLRQRLPQPARRADLSLALLLLLGLAVAPSSLLARELRFITIDVAPWASRGPAGQAFGIFPDLVHELELRTGHSIRMAFEPFARIERELEAGHQDCTIIIWNDARARLVVRGADVMPHPMGVIARRGVALHDYADLQPLAISVLRGAPIAPRFDADTTLRKDFDTDYVIGLRKIEHRRVDAIAGAITTLRHLAREMGMAELLGPPLVLNEVPLTLQCSRRSPHLDLMPQLNEAIRQMVRDGSVGRIKAEYEL